MKLQIQHHKDNYTHNIHNNTTVAVYQPSRLILQALESKLEVNEEAILTIEIGIARMHPKEDRWVKKIGREIAVKNMKPVQYKLRSITKQPGETRYSFYSETERNVASFLLSNGYKTAFLTYTS